MNLKSIVERYCEQCDSVPRECSVKEYNDARADYWVADMLHAAENPGHRMVTKIKEKSEKRS